MNDSSEVIIGLITVGTIFFIAFVLCVKDPKCVKDVENENMKHENEN